MNFKKQAFVLILLYACMLCGCSGNKAGNTADTQGEQTAESEESGLQTLEKVPQLDYPVPESVPGILVNQAGYAVDSKKIAIFYGDKIPDTFEVVDEQTGAVVYSGKVELKETNDHDTEMSGIGDFEQVTDKGRYYIRSPYLGRSYSFYIEEDIYSNIFHLAERQYYYNRCGITLVEELAPGAAHIACHTNPAVLREDSSIMLDVSGGWHMDEYYTKNVMKGSQVMANLLLAFELYTEAFDDNSGIPESENNIPDILDEIKWETDWMLKMQDSKTGGIYSAVVMQTTVNAAASSGYEVIVEPITLEATAAFSAVMAKFSYIYQEFDQAYAMECLRAADRAWTFLENNRENREVEQRFFAAAELYRATGYKKYLSEAEKYLENEIYTQIDNDNNFHGCITYVSTRQKVNTELCSQIMKALMAKAERASLDSGKTCYLTMGNKEQDNNGELLKQMTRLTIADHIITNHEYETVIENHLHYFMGRNKKAISYIDGVGDNNYADIDINLGIMKHIDMNAQLILMMSEVMSWYKEMS